MPLSSLSAVRFEHRTDDGPTLGVGTAEPRLSWSVGAADPDYHQEAYELQVSRGGATETFLVESDEQVLVPWPASPLASREAARVRVRVRGTGDWSGWSPEATVVAGLLSPDDWSAAFISPIAHGAIGAPAPLLRSRFEVTGDVHGALLYATAHGVYEVRVNGRRVGDELLAPGWTAYHDRLRYQTYDVAPLLVPGANEIEVLLGNGWWRGRLGFQGRRALYGDRLALLAQLEITSTDGSVQTVVTDESWTARDSAIIADDLYDGQRTDLRVAAAGVLGADGPVEQVSGDLARLVAPDGPPVRQTGLRPAERLFTSPSGATLVDFGQNVVGWVRLRVRGGTSGAEVVVRQAEVLEDGELGVRPLRTAKATDSYVLSGATDEVLEPSLTFHGFRYAEITGVPDLVAEDVEAVVIGSDLRRTGWFDSSHDLLNRFHENVVWGMRGNFLDVPTDCPQRDERLGWTGDIQIFAPTASFLFDSAGFLTSWLADLTAEQQPDGSVPFVVPDVIGNAGPAAAAWADAAAIVPWVIYQRTGDAAILARHLPSMTAWVDRIASLAGEDRLWSGGFQFGDWLDPDAPPEAPAAAKADADVVATAHFVRSAEIVSLAAEVVGDAATAARYAALTAEVREAFASEYVTAGGRVLSDAPTVYALAIEWALLPMPEQRARAGQRLADLVRTSGFRISTGFVGTPLITDALTEVGAPDVAYRLLLQTGCPSWLYSVTMGATTVWERYDSMLPDGSINPGEMTSFNHYALGAVADWLHRTVAGLAPAAPGYRHLLIRPIPGGGLTRASARHLTPYGEAAVAWSREGGTFSLQLDVPVGVTATVQLPGVEAQEVTHGHYSWDVPDPVTQQPGLGPDPTIRDVLDQVEIWSTIVAAVERAGVSPDEAETARRLRAHLDASASTLVDHLLLQLPASGDTDHLRQVIDPLVKPGR